MRDEPVLHLPIAFYNRGLAWNGKGNHDRAIADFNEANVFGIRMLTGFVQ